MKSKKVQQASEYNIKEADSQIQRMEKGQKRSEGVEGTDYWVQASLKYYTTQGVPGGCRR